MNKPLCVLIVEDSEDDTLLLVRELRRGGYDPKFERVDTAEAMNTALHSQRWDIIISDYSMPDFSAPAALELLKKSGIDLPFIIISGNIGEDIAVEAMKAGAHDYLMKGKLARLIPTIERELREVAERSKRRKAEQALRENEKRFRSLIENALDIITVLDGDGTIRYESPSIKRVLGYKPEELIGKKAFEYIHPDDVQYVLTAFEQILQQPGIAKSVEFRFKHCNGTWRSLEAIGSNLLQDENVKGIVVNSRDITERKRAEETIRQLAYYDTLTGLPNRVLFNDRLTLAIAQAHHNRQKLALMVLDLDQFKTVNDTLGHHMGDQLLQGIATRVKDVIREGDTIARMGGDEFMLLFPGIAWAKDVATIADKILKVLQPSFYFEGYELLVTGSIGIALYPDDSDNVQTLLRNADTAMYRAKAQGRNNYQFHTPTMNAAALERLMIESGLRRALTRNEFVVYYQPQVSLRTGQIVGIEALMRWQHPELGLLSPERFIQVAEETRLIIPISEWILRNACAQNKVWQEAGFPSLRVAVNLSAHHFKREHFAETIVKILKETRLAPNYLELELTESTMMENAETNAVVLNELKEMGISLSIDDFGTGYSSLSYLKRLPINTLKIDQSFIWDISIDPDDTAITRAIIALAHNLKLKVVAEGVETKEQLAFLCQHQCDEVQGYLFSKPVLAEVLTQILREGRRLPPDNWNYPLDS